MKTIVVFLLSLMAATVVQARHCESAGTYKNLGLTREIRTLHAEGETWMLLEINTYIPDNINSRSPKRTVWLAIPPDEITGCIRLLDMALSSYNQNLSQGFKGNKLIDNQNQIPKNVFSTCIVANFESQDGFYVEKPACILMYYYGKDKYFSISIMYDIDDKQEQVIDASLHFNKPKEILELMNNIIKISHKK